ncbi:hypothetical protein [Phocaeicola coprophilus]|uniref:hypothetical protein n=1 Tax=Phocaeicola coprophilus TaxID=387090 RepID=UPI001DA61DC4|nr:hypothetical protein [Phocaeicola coprophilus]HJE48373.1 hypothetical protein [Phocaeicola coprophilus]
MSTIDQDITIKQTLEYSLNKETSDIGIYYGKTGELLLYGLCSSQNQSVIDVSLHYIIETLPSISSFDFPRGLTGIGFGLQYLSDLKLLPVDKNIIFQYLDDKIYSDIANNQSTDLSLLSDKSVLARTLYFYSRLQSLNEPNFYRSFAIRECLILLTTEIKELISIIIVNRDVLLINRPEFYAEIGQCFNVLYYILLLNINKNYCQDLLLLIRGFICDCFEDKNVWNDLNAPFLLRLLYFYTNVSFEVNDRYMKDCAIKWVQSFGSFFRDSMKTDLDICFFNQLNALIGCNINFSYSAKIISDIDSFVLSKYIISFLKQKMCDKSLLQITI